MSVLIALKFTQLSNIITPLFYAMMFVSVIFSLLLFSRKYNGYSSIAVLPLLFLLAGIFSLLVNPIRTEFRPIERYLLFVLMFIGTGPLLQSKGLSDFRMAVFNYMQFFLVIISIGSFITFLLGPSFAYGNAGFKGLTAHSMDLSPISALASLFLVDRIKSEHDSKCKTVYVIFLIITLITMVIAASRGAILGFIASFFLMSYVKDKKVGKIFKTFILLSLVVALFVIINPLSMMDGLEAKMQRTEQQDDFTGGREASLEKRFLEFKENPIFGVGFSSMKYTNVSDSGHFEPGSGWVFILSSMGLMGLILAMSLCFNAIMNTIKYRGTALVAATCLFFVIHSLIEGYILTVGNGFCIYMWLTIGFATDKKILVSYV